MDMLIPEGKAREHFSGERESNQVGEDAQSTWNLHVLSSSQDLKTKVFLTKNFTKRLYSKQDWYDHFWVPLCKH